jgi:hypothetical protein
MEIVRARTKKEEIEHYDKMEKWARRNYDRD